MGRKALPNLAIILRRILEEEVEEAADRRVECIVGPAIVRSVPALRLDLIECFNKAIPQHGKYLCRVAIESRLDPLHPLADGVSNLVDSLQRQAQEPANDRAYEARRVACSLVAVEES